MCSLFGMGCVNYQVVPFSYLGFVFVLIWTLPLASFFIFSSICAYFSKMPFINKYSHSKFFSVLVSFIRFYDFHLEPLKLVNTYRKFVDVSQSRYEFQIEGYNG